QGGSLKAGWLPVKKSQRRDRVALQAPKGVAKTPIRYVALLAKGYGHCRRRAPCGVNVLDSRRDRLDLFRCSPVHLREICMEKYQRDFIELALENQALEFGDF